MTSKELTELIRQNTRIILPNFGAFLVKDGGEKGFIPSNVSFSPFLRYNDGMVEVYVAKSRGISKEEASKAVFDFVENIKNELLEKGVYELEGLGFINRDQRGSLTFTLSQKTEKKAATAKEQIEPTIEKKVEVSQPVVEIDRTDDKKDAWLTEDKTQSEEDADNKPKKIARTKATVEKLTTKKNSKSTKKTEEPIEIESNPVIQDISVEVKTEPPFVLEGEPEKSNEIEPPIQAPTVNMNEKLIVIEKNEPVAQPKLDTKPDDYIVEVINESSPRKSFKGLIYTIIALGILAALFFLLRNYYFPPKIEYPNNETISGKAPESIIKDDAEVKDKIEKPKDDIDKSYNEQTEYDKFVAEQKEKEKKQEEAVANSLIEKAKEKEKIKSNATSTGGVKFYVIAGSFKSVDNARNYANELNKSGFDAAIVVQPSGMNAVHIGSYPTHEAATKAMNEFKLKLKNLWVLKK